MIAQSNILRDRIERLGAALRYRRHTKLTVTTDHRESMICAVTFQMSNEEDIRHLYVRVTDNLSKPFVAIYSVILHTTLLI